VVAVAQYKGVQLLACLALLSLHVITRPGQVAHGLLLGIRHPDRRQIATAGQPGQLEGIPPIGLDPFAGRLRNPRGRHHLDVVAARQQLAVQTIPTGPGLIDKLQLAPAITLAEPSNLTLDPLGRIGNLTFVNRLLSPRLSNGDRNRLFVHIQADISAMNRFLFRLYGSTDGVN